MPTYSLTVAFPEAINSAAPHFGGESFEFPAWMMLFLSTARPTNMSQLFCEAASVAGSHVPAAIGWPFDFQSRWKTVSQGAKGGTASQAKSL